MKVFNSGILNDLFQHYLGAEFKGKIKSKALFEICLSKFIELKDKYENDLPIQVIKRKMIYVDDKRKHKTNNDVLRDKDELLSFMNEFLT